MGRTGVPDLKRLRASLGLARQKPSTRAKWRSGLSARRSLLKKCLTPPTLSETRFNANYHRTVAYNLTVNRPLAIALSSIAILTAVNVAFSEPSPKAETITGQVVAYADGLTCLNGNAYWSMLIHVHDHTTDATTRFVQVRFSLPCKETPQWLNRKSAVQKYRLKREQDADSVLKEFLECAPDSTQRCPQMPMWSLVPGAQEEKLPFGQLVPSYISLDLPLVPVV